MTVVIGLDGWTSQGYTLSFLSERPLRHEMEIALRLLASGLTWPEARREVLEKNLFQVRRTSTAETCLKLVRRRITWMDGCLQALFLDGDWNDRSAILLYTFLASYRLPREFVLEELHYRWTRGESRISVDDVIVFLERKKEQHAEMARWTDGVLVKSRQVMMRMLVHYSILVRGASGWSIQPLVIGEDLMRYIRNTPDYRYFLRFMLMD